MEKIKVALIDDHPVVRQGLISLLSQYDDMEVIYESDGEDDVIAKIKTLRPQIALIDIRLKELDGLGLADRLHRSYPEMKIIILTSYDDDKYLLKAVSIGVKGYLLKNTSAEILADSIRAVNNGEICLSPNIAGKAFKHLEVVKKENTYFQTGLSKQEIEILKLIADGLTVTEIAENVFLSERSVKRKTQEILEKLNASSRAQAVAEAYKCGLL